MALANLIDLIAEVAAKRTAREGKNDRDASEQTWSGCRRRPASEAGSRNIAMPRSRHA